jgi:hypothetical protein
MKINLTSLKAILLFCFLTITCKINAQTNATATAILFNGFVVGVTVNNGGSGYGWAPLVTITGGGGSGAGAYTTVSNGTVASVTVTNAGSGYSSTPQVTIDPPSSTPFSSSLILDLPINGTVVDAGPYHFATVTNGGGTFITNRLLQSNSAFALNGQNQALSFPYNANMYPDEFTLSLWINVQNFSAGSTIIQAGDTGFDGYYGFALYFNDSSGNMTYQDYTGSGFNCILPIPHDPFHTGTWTHMAITRTANSCTVYVNGQVLASASNLTPYTKPRAAAMLVGCGYNFDDSYFQFCPFSLDNFHIYNRALAADEVTSLYTSEAPIYVPVLGIVVKQVRILMNVQPPFVYQLQVSSNLVNWDSYGAPFTATNTTAYEDVDVISSAARYFRLLSSQ